MTTNIPYNFEINSNLGPIGTGFISGISNMNNNYNTIPNGIPLSNINIITNVSRFCDIQNNNTDIDTCSICQIPFNNNEICRTINNCNHIFHINCIDKWLHDHTTCPFCRYNLLNIVIPNDTNENNTNENDTNENNTNENEDIEDIEESEDNEDNEYNEYNEYNEDNEDSKDSEDNEDNEDNEDSKDSEDSDDNEYETTPNINLPNLINTGPILNDINNFVNLSTPFINSFISTSSSNVSPILNSEHINRHINTQINNFVNNLSPLLNSFSNFSSNINRN